MIWCIIFFTILNIFSIIQFNHIPREGFNQSDYFLFHTLPRGVQKDIAVINPFDKYVTWAEDYLMIILGMLGGLRVYFVVRNFMKHDKENQFANFFMLIDKP
jgi:hypothetical protein